MVQLWKKLNTAEGLKQQFDHNDHIQDLHRL